MKRGGGRSATTAAAVGNGGGEGTAETPIKLAEATMKKLRKSVGVENLIVSEAVPIRESDPQATRATGIARALLLHLGVRDEQELDKTSKRWGSAIHDRAKELGGEETKVSWQSISEWTQMTVIVVSSVKEIRIPENGIADRNSLFVGRGAGDNFFVGLHPRRDSDEVTVEAIEDKIRIWREGQNPRKRGQEMIVMTEEETESNQRTRLDPKRSRGISEEEEPDFEMARDHPVLEEWNGFDEWKKQMRWVRATKALVWNEFVGEAITDRFEMVYTALYGHEFSTTRLLKAVFVDRVREVRDTVLNESTSTNGFEPRLFQEPEAVPQFIKDYMTFLKSAEGKKMSKLEQVERLLRAIEEHHRDWHKVISADVKLFKTQQNAEACLVRVFGKLEDLGKAETERRAAASGRGSSGGRGGGWHQRYGHNWNQGGNGGGQATNWNQGGNGGGQATNQMDLKLGAGTPALGDNRMATQQAGVKLGAGEPAALFGNNQNTPRGGTLPYPQGGGSPGEKRVKFACYNCNSPEHGSYDCPEPKRCSKCGSTQHLKFRCDGSGPGRGSPIRPDSMAGAGGGQAASGQANQYIPNQFIPRAPALGQMATATPKI
jgi:hypothetical protein